MPPDRVDSSSSSSDSEPDSKRRRRTKWDPDAGALAISSPTAGASQRLAPSTAPRLSGVMEVRPRVYVGNLDPIVSEQELMQIFTPFGPVTSIDMPKEGNPPVRKGFAFVEFMDQKSADQSIQVLKDFFLNGRRLRVGQPTAQKRANAAPPVVSSMIPPMAAVAGAVDPGLALSGVDRRRVFVSNIPPDTQQATIQTVFQTFGMITKVEAHSGYFVVEFASEASVMQALQAMQGFKIGGVALTLSRSAPAPRSPSAVPPKPAGPPLPSKIKVLLLENMVGPGEADEDLAGEVGEECLRFGKVAKVRVYEKGPERHVRVFVKFKDEEAGGKAGAALNGRWFGGRQVRASLYSEEAFAAGDLEK